MSQAAADALDRTIGQMREETQAQLPEEDRMARHGQALCRANHDGYSCSKKLGHEKAEHVAHGMLGDVAARWEA